MKRCHKCYAKTGDPECKCPPKPPSPAGMGWTENWKGYMCSVCGKPAVAPDELHCLKHYPCLPAKFNGSRQTFRYSAHNEQICPYTKAAKKLGSQKFIPLAIPLARGEFGGIGDTK